MSQTLKSWDIGDSTFTLDVGWLAVDTGYNFIVQGILFTFFNKLIDFRSISILAVYSLPIFLIIVLLGCC